jgi:hypothetical protein
LIKEVGKITMEKWKTVYIKSFLKACGFIMLQEN